MQESTTGMMSLIADDIAALAGTFYPAAAVLIGSLGSFITGTAWLQHHVRRVCTPRLPPRWA